jgi:hypothetical protein
VKGASQKVALTGPPVGRGGQGILVGEGGARGQNAFTLTWRVAEDAATADHRDAQCGYRVKIYSSPLQALMLSLSWLSPFFDFARHAINTTVQQLLHVLRHGIEPPTLMQCNPVTFSTKQEAHHDFDTLFW